MKQIIYAPIRDGVLEICRGLKSLRSSMIGPGLNLCRAIKSWSIKGGGLKDYFFLKLKWKTFFPILQSFLIRSEVIMLELLVNVCGFYFVQEGFLIILNLYVN